MSIPFYTVQLHTVDSTEGRLTLHPPMSFQVCYHDRTGYYVAHAPDCDEPVVARGIGDMMEEIYSYCQMLFDEYALEEPELLSPKAQELRDELRDRIIAIAPFD